MRNVAHAHFVHRSIHDIVKTENTRLMANNTRPITHYFFRSGKISPIIFFLNKLDDPVARLFTNNVANVKKSSSVKMLSKYGESERLYALHCLA